jgi:hypothetical protein
MSAQAAPNFSLAHVTGRVVSLSDYRGRPVVILVNGRDSIDQARQIVDDLRSRYTWQQLPLLGVVDLGGLPKLMQGIARGRLQSGYQEEVKKEVEKLRAQGQPVPDDPSHLVTMLPDWDGKVAASFGLQDVNRQAVAVLVDGEGFIRGYGAGAQGGQQILSLFG